MLFNFLIIGTSKCIFQITAVPAMEETIRLLRKTTPETKIMVGGAVLTKTYADMIGADFYGKDAMDAVRIAQKVFE